MDEKNLIAELGKMMDQKLEKQSVQILAQVDEKLEKVLAQVDEKLEDTTVRILAQVDEKLEDTTVRILAQVDEKLEMQAEKITDDIKEYIRINNIAIGEVFTSALERTEKKITKIERVTKDNLYDIAVLKHG